MKRSIGDLLVLPEYALTGSLVLDKEANVHDWDARCREARTQIHLVDGKHLLINTLEEINGQLRNCCELLPEREFQFKLSPDETELDHCVVAGTEQEIFSLTNRRFKTIICSDIRRIDEISTEDLDFVVYVYHFTEENCRRVISEAKNVAKERNLPILASSLVSDKNNGFTSYIDAEKTISLPVVEGILEIEL